VKVAIRDDDTCALTPPEALARAYGRVWDHAPVSLAVVPFATGYPRAGIARSEWYVGTPRPLESSAAIVEALRELQRKGRIAVALHGYTHEDYADGHEFQAGPDLEWRLREGRRYLETLLGVTVSVFVPPHNALSRRGLAAVSAARLDVLGTFAFYHPASRPVEWRSALNWVRLQRFRRATGRARTAPLVFPHVLRFARHREFGCHGLIPGVTAADLVRGFEEARRFGGDFCIATHHWELDDTLRGVLEDVLAHAARHADVRFVTAEELFA
jgi:hypothetical protein